MKTLITIAAALLLVGCDTTKAVTPEPIVRTVEVKVQVPVPCDAHLSPKPAYPDTAEALKAASNDPVGTPSDRAYKITQLLLAGRTLRQSREGELEGALAVCTAPVTTQ